MDNSFSINSPIQDQINQIEKTIAAFKNKATIMPTRALQPGQSATISPVKPNINQRVDMGDYINDFSDKKIELRRLEKQLTQSYPGIDQTTTKTRIDKLKKEIDNALNRFSRKEFDSEWLAALEDLIRHANIEKDNLDVNRFNIDLDRFQKAFAMSNKGFDEALSSGHEILIHGEYIAVLGSFEELLREALNAN